MPKPADMLDSKQYCELLLHVAVNPKTDIDALSKATDKKRTTLVEQLNRLTDKGLVTKHSEEKKYFYSANYEGLASLFYDEILKKEFNASDIWFSKTNLMRYGLPKYIEEAFLSLKKNLPQTSIRLLLVDLAKTIDVDHTNIRSGDKAGNEYQVNATFVLQGKRFSRIQAALLEIYLQHLEPVKKSKTFEKFKEGLRTK